MAHRACAAALAVASAVALAMSAGGFLCFVGPMSEQARSASLRAHARRAEAPAGTAPSASWSVGATAVAAAALAAGASLRLVNSRQGRAPTRTAQPLAGGSYVPVVPSASTDAATVMQANTRKWGPVFNYNESLLKSPPQPRKADYSKDRRKALWLKYSLDTKMYGRKRNCHRIAKQAVMYALKMRYRSRRVFKRTRRELWIKRVSNNSKLHGVRYNVFICRLKEKNININRKILSQLGVYDRAVFTNVLETAIPEWKQLKEEADNRGKKKEYTIKELDDIAIPYFEATIPELYTDPTIRFNRQVKDWGVEYTIDVGDEEEWRDLLPKMPELANFQLPDHMLQNSRRQLEEIPIETRMVLPDEKTDEKYAAFMDQVRAVWKDEEEKKERGEEVRPKKEGVSRDDWFADEPQSWF
mmetsp:Transcript_3306/g.7729  ORF Transcript_3306/g.7729 Transcript_3306/m.7729 type:complete len:414 (+) Transcript_3306:58-1299(+)